jgi:spermidine/putrescine-binding protein
MPLLEQLQGVTILWDPKLKGVVSAMDAFDETIPLAALVAGIPKGEIWTMTDQQLHLVKQKIIELKNNVRSFWSDYTDVFNMLANGEVVAAVALADPKTAALLELDKLDRLLDSMFWKYIPNYERWANMWSEPGIA